MKSFVCYTVLMLLVCFTIKAQDKPKNADSDIHSIPIEGLVMKDSMNGGLSVAVDSKSKGDSAVRIPNAYKSQQFIYNMPVKELNGNGLAPMPGTENLDKIKSKSFLNSLKLYNKKKK